MSKKDECFKIFYAHSEAKRERAIEIAMSTTGISQATAFTYYPAWRKEFMSKPYYVALEKDMKEKIKISKEAADKSQETVLNHNKVDIKTKLDNKITEVAIKSPVKALNTPEVKPIVEKDEFKTLGIEEVNTESKEIKRETDVLKPIGAVESVVEELFEVTRLIPVVMQGKYGEYKFAKEGVKNTPNEDFISKDKMDEALEALEIWERCYRKERVQEC